MTTEPGQNESRTLEGGEIVYLVKDPGAKCKIRLYECHQNAHFTNEAGGLVFKNLEGLPKDWKNREFESTDDAIAFVQQEIKDDKVPRNLKK